MYRSTNVDSTIPWQTQLELGIASTMTDAILLPSFVERMR